MIKLRMEEEDMGRKRKCLNEMTTGEFRRLPQLEHYAYVKYDSIVILPTREEHDSGYAVMEFIPVLGGVPLGRISGISDVIEIEGIGGYYVRSKFKNPELKDTEHIPSWSIDCLFRSGLLRIFHSGGRVSVGDALSCFEIYSESRE